VTPVQEIFVTLLKREKLESCGCGYPKNYKAITGGLLPAVPSESLFALAVFQLGCSALI
jgi:hypothetical protein